MANMVGAFAELLMQVQDPEQEQEEFSEELLAKFHADGIKTVDRYHFLRYVLLRDRIVPEVVLNAAMAQFDAIDIDKNGFLEKSDLETLEKQGSPLTSGRITSQKPEGARKGGGLNCG